LVTTNLKLFIRILSLIGVLCIFFGSAVAQEDPEPPRVWSVKIEGDRTFEGIVIKDVISNEPPSPFKKMLFWKKPGMLLNKNEVKRDVIRIERFYQRRGFDDVIVNYRIEDLNKEWRKSIIFNITENSPIRVNTVDFVISSSAEDSSLIFKNEDFSEIKNNLPYKKGQRYETVNQAEIEGRLVGSLRNLGYPYATSQVKTEIDSVAKQANVILINTSGPRARFDSVIVEGEKNLPAKYIIRETGIQSGELFSENKLREAQREVFSHHMLRFALINIPEQPKDSSINIKVRVKETPLRSIELQFGIGNLTRIEDGWTDIYKLFRAQASWTHRNVRRKGERITLGAKASAVEQRFSANYLFPYLYNTKSSLIISPFIEHNLEPSYEILRGGTVSSFIYHYSPNLTGTISYEFSLNNEITRNSQESLPDSIQAYNVSSFNLNAFYSKSLRRGKKGWSLQPFWELSGLFGESTYSFQQFGMDTRKFTSLSDNIVFAKRINFAGIYYAKQDSLPSDIRSYSGGTNSVRGWNRQELGPKRAIINEQGEFDSFVPIGGRAMISFNTEFRFQLNQLIKGFGVATFLDGGQVWSDFNDIGTRPIQFGVGGGLRYQSPIGPIRVDLAYKVNPTNKDLRIYQGQNYGSAWDRWGLHFSIGQAF
jgi:outer membrane protein insertion porin family